MDQILKYLKSKQYTPIDITELLNENTYSKYVLLAHTRPNVVLYFKKEKSNAFFFKNAHCTIDVNYYFLNRDNYLTIIINDTFDSDKKRCIDGFLNINNELECSICFHKTHKTSNCVKCFYSLCYKCLSEIIKMDANNNFVLKCPQCRYEQILAK